MLERFRPFLKDFLEPIIKRMNLNPILITVLSPFIALISAIFFGSGDLIMGGLFILFSGIFDVFDGAIARYHDKTSVFGGFLDSTMDRFSDAIIVIGLIWGGYSGWLVGVLAIHASITVSYVRASAESKGILCNVGIGERATRLVILVAGAFMGVIFDNNAYMNLAVLFMLIVAYITVVQRIYHVWKLTSHKKRQL